MIQIFYKEIIYSTKNISCKNTQKVKDKNKHKREMMDYLLTCDSIKGIHIDAIIHPLI